MLLNYLYSRHNDKTYTDIEKGVVSDNYTIEKIQVPGKKFEFHFSSSNPNAGEHNGYIYYDALNKIAFLQTEEYMPSTSESGSAELYRHYLSIDSTGNVVSSQEKEGGFFENAVLLKNELKPFQKWSDSTEKIYLKHFGKRKFNFECLNPFSGIGNPTGGSPCYIWDGDGYYTIVFKNEMLKIKMPCESGALFFSADTDYRIGLYYYERLEDDIAFLVYAKNYEQDQLYMIKRK
ncbi:hypothetical protein J2X69_001787 [Algoriphagus sp. 4150]|uniref:hypothetical protein n=1 Tax=Algoriphagus sp. 4150 TaxID=2817756 RepID=UPI0028627D91|nr:hypothetical protein [Algoriphagus sp. 4150]MDR7129450.1 hypothetical protein [Algoriphagus sp. 4150]